MKQAIGWMMMVMRSPQLADLRVDARMKGGRCDDGMSLSTPTINQRFVTIFTL
jgi:hypothetical protein